MPDTRRFLTADERLEQLHRDREKVEEIEPPASPGATSTPSHP